MKILVYSHDSSFYGATKAIFELTNELREFNDITYMIPLHGVLESKLQEYGYKYIISENPSWLLPTRKKNYSRWNYLKHYIKTNLTFSKIISIEVDKHLALISDKKLDLIIVNTSVAPLGLYVAKRLHVPSLLWIHEPICKRSGWSLPTFFSRRHIGWALDMASAIAGPSEYLKKYVEKTFGISRMQVLPNAIDYKPQLLGTACKYTFGLVGSFSERKGQLEFASRMVSCMSDATLVIYGNGENDYASRLKAFAADNVSKVKICDFEFDLNVIYSSFDIYVNMGIDETFGRTTIEAMRAGKLVFGRRSGATSDHIEHGQNGFLFDDVSEIFDTLRKYDTEEGKVAISEIISRGQAYSRQYEPSAVKERLNTILKSII